MKKKAFENLLYIILCRYRFKDKEIWVLYTLGLINKSFKQKLGIVHFLNSQIKVNELMLAHKN